MNIWLKFRNYIEQLKFLWTILYIGSKFGNYLCHYPINKLPISFWTKKKIYPYPEKKSPWQSSVFILIFLPSEELLTLIWGFLKSGQNKNFLEKIIYAHKSGHANWQASSSPHLRLSWSGLYLGQDSFRTLFRYDISRFWSLFETFFIWNFL